MIYEVLGQSLNCTVTEKLKKADCVYRGGKKPIIEGFPSNVLAKAAELEIMDISGNGYLKAEFIKVARLNTLFAKNLEFKDNASKGGFKTGVSKLRLLEELDLSGTKFDIAYNLTGLIWPKKLTKLTLANMSLTDVSNLQTLIYLQELDLNHNNLRTLPKLNDSADALIIIDLRNNPIVSIDVMQIAPFCELQSFLLEVKPPGTFNSPTNFKNCAPLENWLMKYNIEKEPFFCSKNSTDDDYSKSEIPSEAVDARNICLSGLPATSIFELLLYAVSFSVLFPLLYFGNEAYNNYIAKKQKAPMMPVKRRRRKRRRTTAGPSGDDAEVGSTEDIYETEAKEV